MSAKKDDQNRDIAVNRKARHEYEVIERYEAGIVLTGSEVKSLRAGKIQFGDGYAQVERGQLWLVNILIAEYAGASHFGHAPDRRRKLLMHAAEIEKLAIATRHPGVTLVPLRLYFKASRVKVELGLCRGMKTYDKREALKTRDVKRELDRARKQFVG